MVPTKRLIGLYAAGLLLAPLAGLGSIGWWTLVAYNAGLTLLAYVAWRFAPTAADISIRRKTDKVLSVRVPNRVELIVENVGPMPITGRLRDEPPPDFERSENEFRLHLAPGRSVELAYQVTPQERGLDYFRGTYLRVDGALGLAQRDLLIATHAPIRIYPNVLALREFDLLRQRGRLQTLGVRQNRARGLGTEFESLREYTDGDDYRKIDWKATARQGKLMTRLYEQERNQAVIVVIDIGRKMLAEVDGVTKLDLVLDSSLMLIHAAMHAGDQVGLLVYSDTVRRYLPPKKGKNQIAAIIDAVHDLVAEPVESEPERAFSYLDSRWKRRSLLIGFTDVENEDEAKRLVAAMGGIPRRHITVMARVMDPRLREALSTPVHDRDSLYFRAAGSLLMRDREDVASALSTARVHSLESEPEELAGELVSFYVEVKERALL